MMGPTHPGAWCVAVLCGIALPGCGHDAPAEPLASSDARVAMLAEWVPFHRARDHSLYFLGRFEVRESQAVALGADFARVTVSEPNLPWRSVSAVQGLRLARHYWGRLPTLDEWRTAVQGPSGYRFPWGDDVGNRLRANTWSLQLGRPTRVGTFESGRDLGRNDSCYDLCGNVAEWTSTPYSVVRADRVSGHPLLLHHLLMDVFEDAVPPAWLAAYVPAPWAPASPFLPELARGDDLGAVPLCVAGFSFDQRLPPRQHGRFYWVELGVIPMLEHETRWDVGLRLATDPYTFLARLEVAEGQPLLADRLALRRFVRAYVDEFRAAAKRRAALDREFLGLSEPGVWARVVYDALDLP